MKSPLQALRQRWFKRGPSQATSRKLARPQLVPLEERTTPSWTLTPVHSEVLDGSEFYFRLDRTNTATAGSVTITYGGGTATFGTLQGSVTNPADADYYTYQPSATETINYGVNIGRITFGGITKHNDGIELDETITVNVAGVGTSTIIIRDQELTKGIGVAVVGNAKIDEGQTLTFDVTRSGDVSAPSQVKYDFKGSRAKRGVDFDAPAGGDVLNFAAGERTRQIVVNVLDDGETLDQEADETIVCRLRSTTDGAKILKPNAAGTIRARTINLAPTASAEEDEWLLYPVTRTGPTDRPADVGYRIKGGSATFGNNADYITADGQMNGLLHFAPGEAEVFIKIFARADNIDEHDQTIKIALINPVRGGRIGAKTGVATILDTNWAPTVTARLEPKAVDANGVPIEGSRLGLFFELSHPSELVVTAEYSGEGVGAFARFGSHAASDVRVVNAKSGSTGSIRFQPLTTQLLKLVSTVDDERDEWTEEFKITVEGKISAKEEINSVTFAVADDDVTQVTIIGPGAIKEGTDAGAVARFRLQFKAAVERDVTITFKPPVGSATPNSDFVQYGEVRIQPTNGVGVTHAFLNVDILPDGDDEPDEDFWIELSADQPSVFVPFGKKLARCLLLNDD